MRVCGMEVEFDFVDSIPLTMRGKSKFLIQNVQLWIYLFDLIKKVVTALLWILN